MIRLCCCVSLLLAGLLFWPTAPAAASTIEVAVGAEVVEAPPLIVAPAPVGECACGSSHCTAMAGEGEHAERPHVRHHCRWRGRCRCRRR